MAHTSHLSPLTSHLTPHTPERDTICAPATALGGALAVVRVAGPEAIAAVSTICRADLSSQPHATVRHTYLQTANGEMLDEVVVAVQRAPHSYTGDDSVEISCHGSPYIVRQAIERLIAAGCRMAQPGEFTQRAFLAGKLDLSQAEAVADLIASNNSAMHRVAISQLQGRFSSELSQLRQKLLHLTSLLELELDFSDHEDLEFADRSELNAIVGDIAQHINQLHRSYQQGQALRRGFPVAIVGKTNVGKSTLLNHLIGDDRAIVSSLPGTTRDTIEDVIDIDGVPFRIIDTAGLRQTTDTVEQIGIERTFAAIEKALIVLWLFDEQPTEEEASDIATRCNGKTLIAVKTKADKEQPHTSHLSPLTSHLTPLTSHLTPHTSHLTPHPINISALTGQGIEELKSAIRHAPCLDGIDDSTVIVTNARHFDALCRASLGIEAVSQGLSDGLSGDLLSEDLRQVLDALADITGQTITPDETLKTIFSSFCVGK